MLLGEEKPSTRFDLLPDRGDSRKADGDGSKVECIRERHPQWAFSWRNAKMQNELGYLPED